MRKSLLIVFAIVILHSFVSPVCAYNPTDYIKGLNLLEEYFSGQVLDEVKSVFDMALEYCFNGHYPLPLSTANALFNYYARIYLFPDIPIVPNKAQKKQLAVTSATTSVLVEYYINDDVDAISFYIGHITREAQLDLIVTFNLIIHSSSETGYLPSYVSKELWDNFRWAKEAGLSFVDVVVYYVLFNKVGLSFTYFGDLYDSSDWCKHYINKDYDDLLKSITAALSYREACDIIRRIFITESKHSYITNDLVYRLARAFYWEDNTLIDVRKEVEKILKWEQPQ